MVAALVVDLRMISQLVTATLHSLFLLFTHRGREAQVPDFWSAGCRLAFQSTQMPQGFLTAVFQPLRGQAAAAPLPQLAAAQQSLLAAVLLNRVVGCLRVGPTAKAYEQVAKGAQPSCTTNEVALPRRRLRRGSALTRRCQCALSDRASPGVMTRFRSCGRQGFWRCAL